MKIIMTILVAILRFPGVASATTINDDVPDFVIAAPGSPDGAAEATDVASVSYDLGEKNLRVRYQLENDFDLEMSYEFGLFVKSESGQEARVWSMNRGPNVIVEKGTARACGKVVVQWNSRALVQVIHRSCLPFRKGSFTPYLTTYWGYAAFNLAASDYFNQSSPVMRLQP